MKKEITVGLIGCGNISGAYLTASKTFNMMKVKYCADINKAAAEAKAAEFGLKAQPLKELLANPEVDVILNLTTPLSHTEVNLKALNAGKHVHCEKPFAIDRRDGMKVLALAKKKRLRVGSAPDTFLGAGGQTCRKLIDDGWIGAPVAGTAFMMCRGHESWHPNAGFYYLPGGGPMLDMGPYYITALVNLLGPARRVCAATAMTFKERIATSKELYGRRLPVKVQTHQAGVIEFRNGAIVTLVMSFDVGPHSHCPIEIYGAEGSLRVPDPNTFGGPVMLARLGQDWREAPLSHGYPENMRSIGVADMAAAILSGRKHRCNGAMAFHALDIMLAFEDSSRSGRHVEIQSPCERPEPLPTGLVRGELG